MSRSMTAERVHRILRACVAFREREAREGRPRIPGPTEQLCEALLAAWRHSDTLEAQRDEARDSLGVAHRLAGDGRRLLRLAAECGRLPIAHDGTSVCRCPVCAHVRAILAAWERAARPEGE